MPFMYQSKEWESLSIEEQLKFYKAYLDKPSKRRGRAAEYKDINTEALDQEGLMDSEYLKLQESETFKEIMNKMNMDSHAFIQSMRELSSHRNTLKSGKGSQIEKSFSPSGDEIMITRSIEVMSIL